MNWLTKEVLLTSRLFPGSLVIPERQIESHLHGVATYKNYVYLADLGADKIHSYKVINFE